MNLKSKKFAYILLLAICTLFSTSCATMVDIQRREQYLLNHSELKEEIKTCIKEGKLRIGMTKEEVIASWGKPIDVNKTVGPGGVHEQWVYNACWYDPNPRYTTYLYFEDGKLISWQD